MASRSYKNTNKPIYRVNQFLLLLTGMLLISACGPSFTVRSEVDPSIDFTGYETFGWVGPNPMVSAVTSQPVSPLMEGRIMDAIRAEFENQGFEFKDNVLEADFAVAFTLGSREQIRVDTFPSTFRTTSTWSRSSRAYAFHSTPNTQVRQTTRGTLAIDVFDVVSKGPVWHGSAETAITSSVRDDPEPIITEAVQRILADFGN